MLLTCLQGYYGHMVVKLQLYCFSPGAAGAAGAAGTAGAAGAAGTAGAAGAGSRSWSEMYASRLHKAAAGRLEVDTACDHLTHI